MQEVPNYATGAEVMRAYRKIQRMAVRLAAHI